jgi:hypothetical protein
MEQLRGCQIYLFLRPLRTTFGGGLSLGSSGPHVIPFSSLPFFGFHSLAQVDCESTDNCVPVTIDGTSALRRWSYLYYLNINIKAVELGSSSAQYYLQLS